MIRLFYAALALAACAVAIHAAATRAPEKPLPPLPTADAGWSQCVDAPTRACVLARAMIMAKAVGVGIDRGRAIAQVLGAIAEPAMPDTKAYARDAEMFARGFEGQQDPFRDQRDRDEVYVAVASAYAKAGSFDDALRVLSLLKNGNVGDEAVIALAVAKARRGKVGDGVELVRSHAFTRGSSRSYALAGWELRTLAVTRGEEAPLIALLEEAQASADAKAEMFRFFTGIHHPSEYVAPLTIITAEQTRAGKAGDAVAVARRIKSPGPRAEVLGGIGAVLASAGRTDQALQLAADVSDPRERSRILERAARPGFDEADALIAPPMPAIDQPASRAFDASMRLAGAFSKADERDLAYCAIATANARGGTPDQAAAAAALIRMPWPKFYALLSVGEAQVKAGARAAAVATYARARDAALLLKEDEYLKQLVESQARAGLIEEALATLPRIKGNETSAMTKVDGKWVSMDLSRRFALSAIARAMAKAGRIDEALKTARMTEGENGGVGYGVGVVAEGLAEAGRIDDALRAAKAVDNEGWRDYLLLTFARARVAAGRMDQARNLAPGIGSEHERAQALAAIAGGYARAGDSEAALAVTREALRLSNRLTYAHQTVDVLVDVARALAR